MARVALPGACLVTGFGVAAVAAGVGVDPADAVVSVLLVYFLIWSAVQTHTERTP